MSCPPGASRRDDWKLTTDPRFSLGLRLAASDSSLWFTRHQTCLVPTTMLALRSSALRAARVTAPSRAVAASPRLFASSAPSMKHILSATPADFDELAIKGNRPTLVDFYAECAPSPKILPTRADESLDRHAAGAGRAASSVLYSRRSSPRSPAQTVRR